MAGATHRDKSIDTIIGRVGRIGKFSKIEELASLCAEDLKLPQSMTEAFIRQGVKAHHLVRIYIGMVESIGLPGWTHPNKVEELFSLAVNPIQPKPTPAPPRLVHPDPSTARLAELQEFQEREGLMNPEATEELRELENAEPARPPLQTMIDILTEHGGAMKQVALTIKCREAGVPRGTFPSILSRGLSDRVLNRAKPKGGYHVGYVVFLGEKPPPSIKLSEYEIEWSTAETLVKQNVLRRTKPPATPPPPPASVPKPMERRPFTEQFMAGDVELWLTPAEATALLKQLHAKGIK
jgi:hypothetical protein